ncbi:MAG: galactose-1-phosphate uridylyltransferase [Candidatus Omnitrophica bacterium CG1_02_49_16]|nr:MAG: galactose-1-phosphate uridylyltransferase [Candidatus Omnitrophica bacterium CG1_02_49_16]
MPQLRKDPVTGRWVIVNVESPRGVDSYQAVSHPKSSRTCPFCPGNEGMTPHEIVSYGRKAGAKGMAGWQVRVVANKFPAVRIEASTEKYAYGIYDKIGGFGAHEVIIENPNHETEIADLPEEHVEWVLRAYRDRCLDLRKDKRFKFILIFKNYGAAAGASLEHPHSQLIALPIVPSRVLGELKGAFKYYEYTDRCIFCDMLNQDRAEKKLTVLEEDGFTAFAPFASRFPFETWVTPKAHEANFDAITDHDIPSLARVIKKTMAKLKKALKDPSYNFMIHTLPILSNETQSYHWHIEIIPHLTQVAGFELGTGFYVNPTPPELAAEILKKQAI